MTTEKTVTDNQESSRGSISVGEDMPKQQARAREILGHYREVGPAGRFGALMIERDLREADEALASGDVVRILRAYAALKEIKE